MNTDRSDAVLLRVVQRKRFTLVAQALSAVALVGTLALGLLATLLSGLLVYQVVHLIASRLIGRVVSRRAGRIIVVALRAVAVITVLVGALLGLVSLLSGGSDSLQALLRKMAEVAETARPYLPEWATSWFPADADAMKRTASAWLREHAAELRSAGREVWLGLIHVLVGMVIGGMVAVSREVASTEHEPLLTALAERVRLLGAAFRSVVFAQVRISALNTVLTAVYLLFVVPWIDERLPLTKTLIAVTFLAGLLPVVGNLISNVVIVAVSLSVSPILAVASLAFLVLIHKLEYFVNARVMGGQIHARAWELLIAMVVMEAAFGLPGLVAAPIYYAYLKNELSTEGLI